MKTICLAAPPKKKSKAKKRRKQESCESDGKTWPSACFANTGNWQIVDSSCKHFVNSLVLLFQTSWNFLLSRNLEICLRTYLNLMMSVMHQAFMMWVSSTVFFLDTVIEIIIIETFSALLSLSLYPSNKVNLLLIFALMLSGK